MKELNITLNGKIVKAYDGETILKAAERHGVEIPTLCHDPRLEPYSSCFVCVVEVEGARSLQTSCSTRVVEGMVINTDNEKVRKARKTALDLLLSNHYADCQAPCKDTCPAGVDVQGYISLIDKGMYEEATALIKEVNPLPAICGRVCVRPCEVACRRNLMDEGAPVGIDYMKRFAADYDLQSEKHYIPEVASSTGKKVAIIGAGPGGISTAYFLQQKGHQCDVYEASSHAGGMLRYGIPEYRLPNDLLDREINCIREIGANIFFNQKLGDNLSYKNLQDNYDAVVLTIGSQAGTKVGVDGDDAEGVLSGIDFLRNMEMTGQKYDFSGKTVAVVGGGNTAMDCCRTSMRCGAEKTYVIYRRTEKEMPANPIEIHESKEEGIEYLFLTNPARINKDENGCLKSMTLLRMELGEPDASGRRRPVPIEGSEFELKLDYVLAAIGQKTKVEFLEGINTHAKNGELKVNRWGNINADEATLQTGIPSLFAAGDGVTGPATLIESIAQAKIAARSVQQFLSGEELKPEPQEFLSKKSNFKTQESKDYATNYDTQKRKEMPVLAPVERFNFNEVELGYDEPMVREEAQRCLECGCVEFFTCDLKKYASEYGVEQNRYAGEFKEYKVDFSHPFVEIDSNKCILCSRCIRICKDVVGADALGLINRGFDTYVAPAMGKSLTETKCESCGMCISTCPTGAISENVTFKPGPVELESYETICNYCSIGCKIEVQHHNGYVMKVDGAEGMVNADGNICKLPRFGYTYLNDSKRITKPLKKQGDGFVEISFEEAYTTIKNKIKAVSPDENAFFAGARLTNEEQYMIQKLARAGAKTNNVSSFHYLGRGDYGFTSTANVPFSELKYASRIFVFGSEPNNENGVASFFINSARMQYGVPIELLTTKEESSMKHKVDHYTEIESYYYFVRAVNHYLLRKGLQNQFFIDGRVEGFEEYKTELLKEDYEELVHKAIPCCRGTVVHFANLFNEESNAVLVFSENHVSSQTARELFNLALITGKLGKTASGLLSLKEKNNSQGLWDMGVCEANGVGQQAIDQLTGKLQESWNVDALPTNINDVEALLEGEKLRNLFVFGEDPVGTAEDAEEARSWFTKADFVVVQDNFMSETAHMADIILPASLPMEQGGSYTNTQRMIQTFEAECSAKVERTSFEQSVDLLKQLGVNGINEISEARDEAMSLLPAANDEKFRMFITNGTNHAPHFNFGGDYLVLFADEEFAAR